MIKILFSILIINTLVFSVDVPFLVTTGDAVVPGDVNYYKHKQDNIEIIYTKNNIEFAKHTSNIEAAIHENYENFYDWTLDEKLSVGLISSQNQIANAFSTQFPNNRQINYIGGTSKIDYFTTTSWLDTLLYHETAHNYQVNVKGSNVSQTLHTFLANGSLFIPIFTVPNIVENNFMLEGNAVLNESWHGNGGRLYSGRLYAQTVMQAKADKMSSGEVYNSNISFPYGERSYIQGGFYNLYMAENYGLKSINSYFKYHSNEWYWPFYTNHNMKKATGINFEDSLKNYAEKFASVDLVMAKGELLASSQFFYSLNNDAKNIFFMTNESGRRAPELVVIDKDNLNITKKRSSWSAAKVVKYQNKYYTQASANTSVIKISQGLFDEDRFILDGTDSKMVQAYLRDGREVYFDVPSSYSEPQLYVGDEFYAQVNSSVYIDKKDNLYYFKQNKKTRTLYKNKTPLFSMKAFYGIVSDVDSKGAVYFIANSKNGSSLYKYYNKKITRVSYADNIVEARLINDDEVLLAAMSANDYYYVKTTLNDIKEFPFEVKLFFEDKDYYANNIQTKRKDTELPNLSENYNSLLDMRYSGTDMYILASANNFVGNINVKLGDPLSQNALNLFLTRDDSDVTIAGAGYQSALFRLKYGGYAYGVINNAQIDSGGNIIKVRDYGLMGYASLPLYKVGYFNSSVSATYYQDSDTISREPFGVTLSISSLENYGVSMFDNYKNSLNLYIAQDREDDILGLSYSFIHDLAYEFYISFDAKYSTILTDISPRLSEQRGVKITQTSYSYDLDPTTIQMKSIVSNQFVKDASFINLGLKKVFNLSSYWFTFPLSIQREVVYANYKYFTLNTFSKQKQNVAEFRLGLSGSFVLLNSLPIPMGIEYIYNDTIYAKESHQLFFTLGTSF